MDLETTPEQDQLLKRELDALGLKLKKAGLDFILVGHISPTVPIGVLAEVTYRTRIAVEIPPPSLEFGAASIVGVLRKTIQRSEESTNG